MRAKYSSLSSSVSPGSGSGALRRMNPSATTSAAIAAAKRDGRHDPRQQAEPGRGRLHQHARSVAVDEVFRYLFLAPAPLEPVPDDPAHLRRQRVARLVDGLARAHRTHDGAVQPLLPLLESGHVGRRLARQAEQHEPQRRKRRRSTGGPAPSPAVRRARDDAGAPAELHRSTPHHSRIMLTHNRRAKRVAGPRPRRPTLCYNCPR